MLTRKPRSQPSLFYRGIATKRSVMRRKASGHRLTRVIIDGAQSVELADLQRVMHRIHQELQRQLPLVPHRPIDSALLGLAARRYIVEAGNSASAAYSRDSAPTRFKDN